MHDNLDAVSRLHLEGLNPKVLSMIDAATEKLAIDRVWVRVVSGLRTAAQQNQLYAQGRTAPGKIVTNARAGESMHNYGLAVDVVPFQIGRTGALNWRPETEQFQHMVAAFMAAGLAWGGDWPGKLGDYDHFQISGLAPTPTVRMREDYGLGTEPELATVWKKIENGVYLG